MRYLTKVTGQYYTRADFTPSVGKLPVRDENDAC